MVLLASVLIGGVLFTNTEKQSKVIMKNRLERKEEQLRNIRYSCNETTVYTINRKPAV